MNFHKKPKRPVNSEEIRKEMLEAIRWVDEVIIFDDLMELVKKIKPDFLVKGGDYPDKKFIIGAQFVERECRGKVIILPYLEGKSTTKLINRIREL